MHDHLVHFDEILRMVTHVITQTIPQDHEINCTNNNVSITRRRREKDMAFIKYSNYPFRWQPA